MTFQEDSIQHSSQDLPEGIEEEIREPVRQLLDAYVEGRIPSKLWLPVERLLSQLEPELPGIPAPGSLSPRLRSAIARLRVQDRAKLPMAAAASSAAELLIEGEGVGTTYGLALDVDGDGELVLIEVREVEIRPSERSRVTINTYGPLARVVALDGGIVANSQFTDSIRRIERLLEKNLPGREIHVECEVAYCKAADSARRRPIEGASLSGAVALAILSKMYQNPLPRNLAASFTVNSDGTIGAVDGALDKARLAARHGLRRLILPAAQSSELEGHREQLPVEILFLTHLDELWGGASGGMSASGAAAPVFQGDWDNLRHRLLAEGLRQAHRFTIRSGSGQGDTLFLR